MENQSDTKFNYIIHSEMAFIKNCSCCDLIFTRERDYKLHMKEHAIKREYQCGQCDKILTTNKGFKKHLLTHNNNEKYQCIYCDLFFSRSSELKRHTKIHTGSTIKFNCNLCEKGFSKIFHLNSHMRVHTKERPFPCVFCEKAFTQNCNLIKHMTTHTGERPCKCTECGRSFSCNSALIEHMNIHTGEKPFLCSRCDKAFSKKSHLERHKLSHTGEKPYQCSQCALAFNQNAHLLRHMLLAHNGEKDIQVILSEGKILKLSSHENKEKHKSRKAYENTIKSNKHKIYSLDASENDNQDCYVVIKNRKLSSEEILIKIEKDIEERKYFGMNMQSYKSELDDSKMTNNNENSSPKVKTENHLDTMTPDDEILENNPNEMPQDCEVEDNILVKINEDYYLLEVENSDGIKMKMPSNGCGSDANTEQENQLLDDVLNAIEMWLNDPSTYSNTNGRQSVPMQPMWLDDPTNALQSLDDATNTIHSNLHTQDYSSQDDALEESKKYLDWLKFE